MVNKKEVIFSKEEQKNSNRIYKSATPKQTTDWYIKWAASGVLLTAMVIRSAGVSNLADTISFEKPSCSLLKTNFISLSL